MARDTDRKVISEHLSLHPGSWIQNWNDAGVLSIFNSAGRELVVTYNTSTGRITHVTYWEPDGERSSLASRHVIEVQKRQRVLDIITTKGHK